MNATATALAFDQMQLQAIRAQRARGGVVGAEDLDIEERAQAEITDIEKLARLALIEYDVVRATAAKTLGVRASTLDTEVAKLRPAGADAAREGSGHAVIFDEPAPWPEAVNGGRLLDELTEALSRYVFMPNEAVTACALWIVHGWAHSAARVSPILAITSPIKRCGKTTLLEVLATLSRRAMPAANITAAALFRAVEKYEPTLLIDEADTFLRGSDELRGILNSGHRRRSAAVIRTVGDDHEPRQFKTWAPKAVALIGKLPPTLADRSIEVALRRRGPGEAVTRWRGELFPDLCSKLSRFASDNEATLGEARPDLPARLHDRAADNWESLFAIADAAGGEWPERARQAASALSSDEDESMGAMLLTDIREMFGVLGNDEVTSADVCAYLVGLESRPWPELGYSQKPITTRRLAKMLAPFGIHPSQVRHGEHNWRGYARSGFEEAFARYLPSPSATPLQPIQDAASSDFLSATPAESVADRNCPKPLQNAACSGVADRNPLKPDTSHKAAAEAYRSASKGSAIPPGFDL